jgi:7,8-dihydro-6-hydroxymethylpterin-pyrophosphokinase
VSVRAYLGLGSNLGDRLHRLQAAVDGLAHTDGVTVTGVSPVYETAPVGGPPQPDYLNAVVGLDNDLGARALHDLEVPHPRLRDRGFVLAPLADLDPRAAGTPPGQTWPGVHRTDLSLVGP